MAPDAGEAVKVPGSQRQQPVGAAMEGRLQSPGVQSAQWTTGQRGAARGPRPPEVSPRSQCWGGRRQAHTELMSPVSVRWTRWAPTQEPKFLDPRQRGGGL